MANSSHLYNNATSVDDDGEGFTAAEGLLFASAYSLMTIAGLILNPLTICIVKKGKSIGSDFKISVINLAVADILLCIFDSSFLATIRYGFPFPQSVLACQFYRFFRRIGHYASLVCSAAISLERFVAVFFPSMAAQYSRRKRFIVVGVIWICATLPGIRAFVSGTLMEYRGRTYCYIFQSPFLSKILDSWLLQLEYIIPAVVIAVVYAMVFVKLDFKKANKAEVTFKMRKDIDQVFFLPNKLKFSKNVFALKKFK